MCYNNITKLLYTALKAKKIVFDTFKFFFLGFSRFFPLFFFFKFQNFSSITKAKIMRKKKKTTKTLN